LLTLHSNTCTMLTLTPDIRKGEKNMKDFEVPDMTVTMLSSFQHIYKSNELALIQRIPSVEDAAEQND